GYRPVHVFQACRAALAASDDASRSALAALIGNPIAFLGALGLPLAGLCGHTIGSACLWRRRAGGGPVTALLLAALSPVVVSTLLVKPRGEVEHIYLLFVPPLVLAGAAAARHWYGRSAGWLAYFVVPFSVVQSTLVEVYFQTFW